MRQPPNYYFAYIFFPPTSFTTCIFFSITFSFDGDVEP